MDFSPLTWQVPCLHYLRAQSVSDVLVSFLLLEMQLRKALSFIGGSPSSALSQPLPQYTWVLGDNPWERFDGSMQTCSVAECLVILLCHARPHATIEPFPWPWPMSPYLFPSGFLFHPSFFWVTTISALFSLVKGNYFLEICSFMFLCIPHSWMDFIKLWFCSLSRLFWWLGWEWCSLVTFDRKTHCFR